MFKTPGKHRGKTPRTARKREALAPRQPLTDLFAPNLQTSGTPTQATDAINHVVHFKIAEDVENLPSQNRPMSRGKSPQRIGKPGNTDSGYHGMTEDEMELDVQHKSSALPSQQQAAQTVSVREDQSLPQRPSLEVDDSRPSTDASFASARESVPARSAPLQEVHEEQESDDATVPDDDVEMENPAEDRPVAAAAGEVDDHDEIEDMDVDLGVDEYHHGMASPEQPLQRKSSFTFSALPAREPLTGKRSVGARNSQADVQHRNSVFARSIGKGHGVSTMDQADHPAEKPEEVKAHSKTSTQLLHERITLLGKTKDGRASKSTAHNVQYPQLPTDNVDEPAEDAPLPPPKDAAKALVIDDEDDWIAPTKSIQLLQSAPTHEDAPAEGKSPARPGLHQKSISTTNIPSPSRYGMLPESRLQKAMSVSHPNLVAEIESTTPAASPSSKKHHEGPLSASKNRLWSALKSAKNIFASSASASAAAKLEAHNSSPMLRSPNRDISNGSKTAAVVNMPGALYPETQLLKSPSRPMSVISASPSRKTRSSNESDKKRDKELKAQQKAVEELEKVRERERRKAAKQQDDVLKAEKVRNERQEKENRQQARVERPATAESDAAREDMPPPPPPKGGMPGKLKSVGKPLRPGKDAAKSKPAPVNVRVASQMQRVGQGPSHSSVQYEGTAPQPPPKPSTGMRPGSAQSNVRSSTVPPANNRLKALEAAARKKEQEDREKQRKAEQKKELERKRAAAKLEEEKKAEAERRAEEQRRAQEAKLAAQRQAEKQAAEAKRREQQRVDQQRLEQQRQNQQRLEQQRVEQQQQREAAQKAKAAHELAEAIQRERAQQQPHPRGDVGSSTLRHINQKTTTDHSTRPPIQPNPAKPPKRVFTPDEDESASQAQRPGLQRGPPSHQHDAKRRKTEEEEGDGDDDDDEQRHSVMAPPKRPSTMRKVCQGVRRCEKRRESAQLTLEKETFTKFPHGYAHAPPPPATSHSTSIFKSVVSNQHQMQHAHRPVPTHPSQTIQVSNARIPFAENANPPAISHYVPSGHPGHENAAPGANAANNKFKTPARPTQAPKSAKSSPMYPNGDSIALPEIATDSEEEDDDDEDEDTGFRAPSWVASPALRELLTQQQLVDPESVFGPIGELKMEEVFRGTKNPERLKRFRDRGSSAAWALHGDAVTSAEKRRDKELRERVAKEGGWRYEPGV